ncbi:MAG: MFS transporter [Candidatus Micrarchaeota archaeon]
MKIFSVSRNSKLLGIASMLTDISTEMIYPLLPFFLTDILLAPVFVIGLMESLGEFTAAAFGFLSGVYSDSIGKRKRLILTGYGASAAFKGFLALVTAWPQVILLRVLDRAGKGIRDVPRDALIGLSEPKDNLGKAFGFRKFMDNIGAILGPLAATAFVILFFNSVHTEESYRTLFLIAVIPAVLAIAALFFLTDPHTEKTPSIKILTGVFNIPNFRQFMVAGIVFSVGQFSILFFLLRANEYLPLFLIPLSYLAFNVFYTIFAYPAGVLSDKLGARNALVLAMLCFLATLFGIGFFPSMLVIFVAFALLGLFMAIAETAPQVFLVKTVPAAHYASAIGSYKGILGLTALPANLLAGVLWTMPLFGIPSAFILSIITTALAIVMLLVLVKEKKR